METLDKTPRQRDDWQLMGEFQGEDPSENMQPQNHLGH